MDARSLYAVRESFKCDALIAINEEIIRRCRAKLNGNEPTLGDILDSVTNPLANISLKDLEQFKKFLGSL